MSRSQRLKECVRYSLLLASVAATAPSFAQSSTAGGIPEVVVTAQKREESLQDVNVAISAFTNEQRDQ